MEEFGPHRVERQLEYFARCRKIGQRFIAVVLLRRVDRGQQVLDGRSRRFMRAALMASMPTSRAIRSARVVSGGSSLTPVPVGRESESHRWSALMSTCRRIVRSLVTSGLISVPASSVSLRPASPSATTANTGAEPRAMAARSAWS
ncbi:hypothetical protein DL991_32590 [Amycolatopsis sp. WAC 01375]|nr:hypothetical protein DL991_32590 [Amycolatopsis sp. WAC 01375]